MPTPEEFPPTPELEARVEAKVVATREMIKRFAWIAAVKTVMMVLAVTLPLGVLTFQLGKPLLARHPAVSGAGSPAQVELFATVVTVLAEVVIGGVGVAVALAVGARHLKRIPAAGQMRGLLAADLTHHLNGRDAGEFLQNPLGPPRTSGRAVWLVWLEREADAYRGASFAPRTVSDQLLLVLLIISAACSAFGVVVVSGPAAFSRNGTALRDLDVGSVGVAASAAILVLVSLSVMALSVSSVWLISASSALTLKRRVAAARAPRSRRALALGRYILRRFATVTGRMKRTSASHLVPLTRHEQTALVGVSQ